MFNKVKSVDIKGKTVACVVSGSNIQPNELISEVFNSN